MIHRFITRTSGFTLVELMIVIAMIGILMGIALFPYGYYMDRARTEKVLDAITQEWILAHNEIRNGLIMPGTYSHAYMFLDMSAGSGYIDIRTSTGADFSTSQSYKRIPFDVNITIHAFSGEGLGTSGNHLIYRIAPPDAQGMFSTGGSSYTYLTGIIMTVGYPNATTDSRRAREIYLRPYFQ